MVQSRAGGLGYPPFVLAAQRHPMGHGHLLQAGSRGRGLQWSLFRRSLSPKYLPLESDGVRRRGTPGRDRETAKAGGAAPPGPGVAAASQGQLWAEGGGAGAGRAPSSPQDPSLWAWCTQPPHPASPALPGLCPTAVTSGYSPWGGDLGLLAQRQ